jgi:multidrug efflux pump subunit AcrA (membrane-fusion protein)
MPSTRPDADSRLSAKPVPRLYELSNRRGRGVAAGFLVTLLAVTGCHHEEETRYKSVAKPPTVKVIQPEVRTIVRTVGQPSFIEAYERTSIFPKLIGYIEKWNVDIGDKVKKGQELCKLFVPELVEDFQTKKATVKLDDERVTLAEKLVEVADADVKAAEARLVEAKAILAKFQAEVDRWETEVKRLKNEVSRGVVDPQILLESTNQFHAATAAREAAKATISKAEAELLSRQANLAKTKVDVSVAKADLAVATSEAKRIEAWVGYITLPAPFDGVIVARNANTLDFVMPATGDPSADSRSPHLSPSGESAPIYVVDRTDIVRIFVDIPESDANYVNIGTKATVLARAYRDQPIQGSVTRTSWALNVKSRTLRAEIDLPNPNSQLLPGMYAYAKVIIERKGVPALPASAFTHSGEKTYCWVYRDGHAVRSEVRTGITDGNWYEITNLQKPTETASGDDWSPVDGTEKLILGDLAALADGQPVEIETEQPKTKVTEEESPHAKDAARAESKSLRQLR